MSLEGMQREEQSTGLAVKLRQIAALLEHDSLTVVAGMASVEDKDDCVRIVANLLLKRLDVTEFDEDNEFLVDVYTRREWRQRQTKARQAQLVLWASLFVTFNLIIYNL